MVGSWVGVGGLSELNEDVGGMLLDRECVFAGSVMTEKGKCQDERRSKAMFGSEKQMQKQRKEIKDST